MRQTRAEWAYKWETEQRGRATYKYNQRPTYRSVLLIQMRTEKIGLRNHLWKRKVPEFDDPGCDYGEGRQTIPKVSGPMTEGIWYPRTNRLEGNLKRFRRCDIVQRDEVEYWGETEDYPGIAVLRTAGSVYDIINQSIPPNL
ncbi:zinc knuckle protein [Rutstroemia sp. NJR-2017a WRK4]|nr:zinc knuckle protein [Rutstroemia sp. NJR-2017a WRK4]